MIINHISAMSYELRKLLSNFRKNKYISEILVFCLLMLVFNIGNSGSWYFSDSARDLEEVFGMVSGDWRLLGPKLSFFGLFSGPYYYYFLFPIVKLFASTPHIIIFVHSIVVSLLMLVLFKNISKKYGRSSFLFFLFIVSTPSVLIVARNISNGLFIIFPFVLTILILLKDDTNWKRELFVGLLIGIMVNSHPITIVGAGEIWLLLVLRSKNKFHTSIRFLSTFLITFLPILLFEIRHEWIMLKSIDLNQVGISAKDWHLFFKERLVSLPHLANILVLTFIFFYSLKHSHFSTVIKSKLSIVMYFNLMVIFMILFYRSSSHYLFIYIWLIAISSGYVILNSNPKKKMIILSCCINIFLAIVVFGTTSKSYNPNWYQQKVEKVVRKGWLGGGKNTNFMLIRKSYSTAPQGYEYRYFAKIMGKDLLLADDLTNTEKLIIFSEDPDFDFKKEKSYEMSLFRTDKTKIIAKFSDKDLTYFLLTK